jgi:gluconokinase
VGVLASGRTFDDRFCKLVDIDFEALRERVLQGGSDEEILEWCFQTGRQPDAEQIEIWNTFMEKRGWRDSGSSGLDKAKTEAGLAQRDDIQTFFHLMDVEEGRQA